MSYRNPARLIDTQTIQHYKDMMNSLSRTVSTLGQRQRFNQAKLNQEIKAAEEQTKKDAKEQRNIALRLGTANNAVLVNGQELLDYQNTAQVSADIDAFAKLQTKDILTQEDMIFSQNVAGMANTIKNDYSYLATLSEGWDEALTNQGEMGAYAPGQDPKYTKFIRGFVGNNIKGERSMDIDNSQPGGSVVTYTFKPADGSESISYTSSQLRGMNNDPNSKLFVTIPNETEAMTKLTQDVLMQKQIGTGKALNKVKDQYYLNQPTLSKTLPNGDKVYYKEINSKLFADNTRDQIISNIESKSPQKQIALYNYFGRKMGSENRLGYNEEPTPEDIEELADMYTAYTITNFADNGGQRIIQTIKKSGGSGGGKASNRLQEETSILIEMTDGAIENKDPNIFKSGNASINVNGKNRQIRDAAFEGDNLKITYDKGVSGGTQYQEDIFYNINTDRSKIASLLADNIKSGSYGANDMNIIGTNLFKHYAKNKPEAQKVVETTEVVDDTIQEVNDNREEIQETINPTPSKTNSLGFTEKQSSGIENFFRGLVRRR